MAEPTLRHFSMPGGSRMDPVPNPIGRTGLPADKFFKQGVEGNQPGTRFFCQFTDKDGQTLRQFFPPGIIRLLPQGALPGDKRRAKHQLHPGVLCPDLQ